MSGHTLVGLIGLIVCVVVAGIVGGWVNSLVH